MWWKIGLRTRIYILLSALVCLSLIGGSIMVWHTYRMESLLAHIIDEDMVAFQTAEALENALVNQKGFVSYYFLDGNPEWLAELGKYRQIFREQLKAADSLTTTPELRRTLAEIQSEYERYIRAKDQVIAYYRSGERNKGAELHKEVRQYFFRILELCEGFKGLFRKRVDELRSTSLAQAERLRVVGISAMVMVVLLGGLTAVFLVHHILGPVRRLVMETESQDDCQPAENEVTALSRRFHGLIEDMDHTQFELEKSREILFQSEKMVLVGKLAAGMAHSIRNPLTSVKMRLFSLHRTLNLSGAQRDDFEVISEEIGHVNTIVENFLEFSRPPKLKIQSVQPSEVVDLTLQLLKHRLEAYDVHIQRPPGKEPLPEIQADPEQLKEVLVNLVVNSCEAMSGGGNIRIEEKPVSDPAMGEGIAIYLWDTGPGIPRAVREKVFQPFFTTKEDGTGLGLSIAARIIQEHGGNLSLEDREGEGACFVITLPIQAGRGL